MAVFGAMSLGVHGANAAPAPLAGMWGGDRAILTLTDQGGRLQFDCGFATFDEAVRPNGKGRFKVTALYFPEHGGPTAADQPPAELTAALSGVVQGESLRLTFRPAGRREAQTLNMVAGQRLKLIRCL